MSSRNREYRDAATTEIASWPGVSYEFDKSKRHNVLLVTYNGERRKVFYPESPSDSRRGASRMVCDLKGVLRKMGAARSEK